MFPEVMAKEQAELDLIARDHAVRIARLAGIDNPEEKVALEVPATIRFGDPKLYELMLGKARAAVNEEALQRLEGSDSEPAFDVPYPQVTPEGKPEGESLPEGVSERSLEDVDGVGEGLASDLRAAGFNSPQDLTDASDEALLEVDGIGPKKLEQIRSDVG